MISRVCFCFRLSRVSYSLYCNKLSVHNKKLPGNHTVPNTVDNKHIVMH